MLEHDVVLFIIVFICFLFISIFITILIIMNSTASTFSNAISEQNEEDNISKALMQKRTKSHHQAKCESYETSTKQSNTSSSSILTNDQVHGRTNEDKLGGNTNTTAPTDSEVKAIDEEETDKFITEGHAGAYIQNDDCDQIEDSSSEQEHAEIRSMEVMEGHKSSSINGDQTSSYVNSNTNLDNQTELTMLSNIEEVMEGTSHESNSTFKNTDTGKDSCSSFISVEHSVEIQTTSSENMHEDNEYESDSTFTSMGQSIIDSIGELKRDQLLSLKDLNEQSLEMSIQFGLAGNMQDQANDTDDSNTTDQEGQREEDIKICAEITHSKVNFDNKNSEMSIQSDSDDNMQDQVNDTDTSNTTDQEGQREEDICAEITHLEVNFGNKGLELISQRDSDDNMQDHVNDTDASNTTVQEGQCEEDIKFCAEITHSKVDLDNKNLEVSIQSDSEGNMQDQINDTDTSNTTDQEGQREEDICAEITHLEVNFGNKGLELTIQRDSDDNMQDHVNDTDASNTTDQEGQSEEDIKLCAEITHSKVNFDNKNSEMSIQSDSDDNMQDHVNDNDTTYTTDQEGQREEDICAEITHLEVNFGNKGLELTSQRDSDDNMQDQVNDTDDSNTTDQEGQREEDIKFCAEITHSKVNFDNKNSEMSIQSDSDDNIQDQVNDTDTSNTTDQEGQREEDICAEITHLEVNFGNKGLELTIQRDSDDNMQDHVNDTDASNTTDQEGQREEDIKFCAEKTHSKVNFDNKNSEMSIQSDSDDNMQDQVNDTDTSNTTDQEGQREEDICAEITHLEVNFGNKGLELISQRDSDDNMQDHVNDTDASNTTVQEGQREEDIKFCAEITHSKVDLDNKNLEVSIQSDSEGNMQDQINDTDTSNTTDQEGQREEDICAEITHLEVNFGNKGLELTLQRDSDDNMQDQVNDTDASNTTDQEGQREEDIKFCAEITHSKVNFDNKNSEMSIQSDSDDNMQDQVNDTDTSNTTDQEGQREEDICAEITHLEVNFGNKGLELTIQRDSDDNMQDHVNDTDASKTTNQEGQREEDIKFCAEKTHSKVNFDNKNSEMSIQSDSDDNMQDQVNDTDTSNTTDQEGQREEDICAEITHLEVNFGNKGLELISQRDSDDNMQDHVNDTDASNTTVQEGQREEDIKFCAEITHSKVDLDNKNLEVSIQSDSEGNMQDQINDTDTSNTTDQEGQREEDICAEITHLEVNFGNKGLELTIQRDSDDNMQDHVNDTDASNTTDQEGQREEDIKFCAEKTHSKVNFDNKNSEMSIQSDSDDNMQDQVNDTDTSNTTDQEGQREEDICAEITHLEVNFGNTGLELISQRDSDDNMQDHVNDTDASNTTVQEGQREEDIKFCAEITHSKVDFDNKNLEVSIQSDSEGNMQDQINDTDTSNTTVQEGQREEDIKFCAEITHSKVNFDNKNSEMSIQSDSDDNIQDQVNDTDTSNTTDQDGQREEDICAEITHLEVNFGNKGLELTIQRDSDDNMQDHVNDTDASNTTNQEGQREEDIKFCAEKTHSKVNFDNKNSEMSIQSDSDDNMQDQVNDTDTSNTTDQEGQREEDICAEITHLEVNFGNTGLELISQRDSDDNMQDHVNDTDASNTTVQEGQREEDIKFCAEITHSKVDFDNKNLEVSIQSDSEGNMQDQINDTDTSNTTVQEGQREEDIKFCAEITHSKVNFDNKNSEMSIQSDSDDNIQDQVNDTDTSNTTDQDGQREEDICAEITHLEVNFGNKGLELTIQRDSDDNMQDHVNDTDASNTTNQEGQREEDIKFCAEKTHSKVNFDNKNSEMSIQSDSDDNMQDQVNDTDTSNTTDQEGQREEDICAEITHLEVNFGNTGLELISQRDSDDNMQDHVNDTDASNTTVQEGQREEDIKFCAEITHSKVDFDNKNLEVSIQSDSEGNMQDQINDTDTSNTTVQEGQREEDIKFCAEITHSKVNFDNKNSEMSIQSDSDDNIQDQVNDTDTSNTTDQDGQREEDICAEITHLEVNFGNKGLELTIQRDSDDNMQDHVNDTDASKTTNQEGQREEDIKFCAEKTHSKVNFDNKNSEMSIQSDSDDNMQDQVNDTDTSNTTDQEGQREEDICAEITHLEVNFGNKGLELISQRDSDDNMQDHVNDTDASNTTVQEGQREEDIKFCAEITHSKVDFDNKNLEVSIQSDSEGNMQDQINDTDTSNTTDQEGQREEDICAEITHLEVSFGNKGLDLTIQRDSDDNMQDHVNDTDASNTTDQEGQREEDIKFCAEKTHSKVNFDNKNSEMSIQSDSDDNMQDQVNDTDTSNTTDQEGQREEDICAEITHLEVNFGNTGLELISQRDSDDNMQDHVNDTDASNTTVQEGQREEDIKFCAEITHSKVDFDNKNLEVSIQSDSEGNMQDQINDTDTSNTTVQEGQREEDIKFCAEITHSKVNFDNKNSEMSIQSDSDDNIQDQVNDTDTSNTTDQDGQREEDICAEITHLEVNFGNKGLELTSQRDSDDNMQDQVNDTNASNTTDQEGQREEDIKFCAEITHSKVNFDNKNSEMSIQSDSDDNIQDQENDTDTSNTTDQEGQREEDICAEITHLEVNFGNKGLKLTIQRDSDDNMQDHVNDTDASNTTDQEGQREEDIKFCAEKTHSKVNFDNKNSEMSIQSDSDDNMQDQVNDTDTSNTTDQEEQREEDICAEITHLEVNFGNKGLELISQRDSDDNMQDHVNDTDASNTTVQEGQREEDIKFCAEITHSKVDLDNKNLEVSIQSDSEGNMQDQINDTDTSNTTDQEGQREEDIKFCAEKPHSKVNFDNKNSEMSIQSDSEGNTQDHVNDTDTSNTTDQEGRCEEDICAAITHLEVNFDNKSFELTSQRDSDDNMQDQVNDTDASNTTDQDEQREEDIKFCAEITHSKVDLDNKTLEVSIQSDSDDNMQDHVNDTDASNTTDQEGQREEDIKFCAEITHSKVDLDNKNLEVSIQSDSEGNMQDLVNDTDTSNTTDQEGQREDDICAEITHLEVNFGNKGFELTSQRDSDDNMQDHVNDTGASNTTDQEEQREEDIKFCAEITHSKVNLDNKNLEVSIQSDSEGNMQDQINDTDASNTTDQEGQREEDIKLCAEITHSKVNFDNKNSEMSIQSDSEDNIQDQVNDNDTSNTTDQEGQREEDICAKITLLEVNFGNKGLELTSQRDSDDNMQDQVNDTDASNTTDQEGQREEDIKLCAEITHSKVDLDNKNLEVSIQSDSEGNMQDQINDTDTSNTTDQEGQREEDICAEITHLEVNFGNKGLELTSQRDSDDNMQDQVNDTDASNTTDQEGQREEDIKICAEITHSKVDLDNKNLKVSIQSDSEGNMQDQINDTDTSNTTDQEGQREEDICAEITHLEVNFGKKSLELTSQRDSDDNMQDHVNDTDASKTTDQEGQREEDIKFCAEITHSKVNFDNKNSEMSIQSDSDDNMQDPVNDNDTSNTTDQEGQREEDICAEITHLEVNFGNKGLELTSQRDSDDNMQDQVNDTDTSNTTDKEGQRVVVIKFCAEITHSRLDLDYKNLEVSIQSDSEGNMQDHVNDNDTSNTTDQEGQREEDVCAEITRLEVNFGNKGLELTIQRDSEGNMQDQVNDTDASNTTDRGGQREEDIKFCAKITHSKVNFGNKNSEMSIQSDSDGNMQDQINDTDTSNSTDQEGQREEDICAEISHLEVNFGNKGLELTIERDSDDNMQDHVNDTDTSNTTDQDGQREEDISAEITSSEVNFENKRKQMLGNPNSSPVRSTTLKDHQTDTLVRSGYKLMKTDAGKDSCSIITSDGHSVDLQSDEQLLRIESYGNKLVTSIHEGFGDNKRDDVHSADTSQKASQEGQVEEVKCEKMTFSNVNCVNNFTPMNDYSNSSPLASNTTVYHQIDAAKTTGSENINEDTEYESDSTYTIGQSVTDSIGEEEQFDLQIDELFSPKEPNEQNLEFTFQTGPEANMKDQINHTCTNNTTDQDEQREQDLYADISSSEAHFDSKMISMVDTHTLTPVRSTIKDIQMHTPIKAKFVNINRHTGKESCSSFASVKQLVTESIDQPQLYDLQSDEQLSPAESNGHNLVISIQEGFEDNIKYNIHSAKVEDIGRKCTRINKVRNSSVVTSNTNVDHIIEIDVFSCFENAKEDTGQCHELCAKNTPNELSVTYQISQAGKFDSQNNDMILPMAPDDSRFDSSFRDGFDDNTIDQHQQEGSRLDVLYKSSTNLNVDNLDKFNVKNGNPLTGLRNNLAKNQADIYKSADQINIPSIDTCKQRDRNVKSESMCDELLIDVCAINKECKSETQKAPQPKKLNCTKLGDLPFMECRQCILELHFENEPEMYNFAVPFFDMNGIENHGIPELPIPNLAYRNNQRSCRQPIISIRDRNVSLRPVPREFMPRSFNSVGPIVDLRNQVVYLRGTIPVNNGTQADESVYRTTSNTSSISPAPVVVQSISAPTHTDPVIGLAEFGATCGVVPTADLVEDVRNCCHCTTRRAVKQPCGHAVCCNECNGTKGCPLC